MADFSNARINLTLFQQKEEDRKSDKSPHATGALEISVADLHEFFTLALALEPVENWKGDQVVKLRCAAWDKETRDGRPFQSCSISPDRAAEFKPDQPFTVGACEPKELATVGASAEEEI